jgi:Ca-activated chloride channel family protein
MQTHLQGRRRVGKGGAWVLVAGLLVSACGQDAASSGSGAGSGAGTGDDRGGGAADAGSGQGFGEEGYGGAGTGGAWGYGGTPAGGASAGGWSEPGYGGAGGEAYGGAGGGAAGPTPSTNIGFSGAQDFGYVRRLLEDGVVPESGQMEAQGFFAEHHTALPPADCGERVCVHAMVGAMGNLMTGADCTLLQIGLNSPIAANPDNRPPLNLTVVVDVSGSMADENKIEFVRLGLAQMVDTLRDEDQMAIVAYDDVAEVRQEMTPLLRNRAELRAVVDALLPDGSTNIYDGLETGYRQAFANYDSGRQNRLIFLSDGQQTAGNLDPVDILAMSSRYNSDGIGLTSVGLGTSFNLPLMQGLAEQGDGNFYFVEDVGAVAEVFTQELEYFTVPVAFDLQIDVEAGEHYSFGRAYGTSRWEDAPGGNGGSLAMPSVFLAHRVAHDDVTPGGGRRGGGSALLLEFMARDDAPAGLPSSRLATVTFRFREPGSNETITQTVSVELPFGPNALPRVGHFDNPIVTKSFVMLNIFTAMQLAADLFHLDHTVRTAERTLQRVMNAVRDYNDDLNDGQGDVDMQYDLELLQLFVDVLVRNGAPPDPPPPPSEEDWPCD